MKEKTKIIIKTRNPPLNTPVPKPVPVTDSVTMTNPIVDFGRTVEFGEIDRGGTKERTWINYVSFITRFYKVFNLPDTSLFYWEFLSKAETIKAITKYILNKYHVKDGNALAAKLSPFKSIIFRMTGNETVSALSAWAEVVIYTRKNFDNIVIEYGDEIKEQKNIKVIPGPDNWLPAREQLHNISIKRNIDSRVRVLATIYKYGYIFRLSTIFRTYIHKGDEMRSNYNYLDLDNQTWIIVDECVDKLIFPIPDMMARELRAIAVGGSFSRGWLLPQRRGIPYAPEASISSFSSWTKSGLYNYRTYRKLFMCWLKSHENATNYKIFEGVLEENMSFNQITYIPPVPVQELEDFTLDEPPNREIMTAPEREVMVQSTDVDIIAFSDKP